MKPLFLILLGLSRFLAQEQTTGTNANNQKGANVVTSTTVRGRVFATTRAGEVAAAPKAEVYLIKGGADAGRIFNLTGEKEYSRVASLSRAELEDEYNRSPILPDNSINLFACRQRIGAYRKALDSVTGWAKQDSRRASQVLRSTADEQGYFRFTIRAANGGPYILVAFGRSGMNEAVWVINQDKLNITGKPIDDLKVSPPAQACFAP